MDIFKNSQDQIKKIGRIIKLEPEILDRLLEPKRVIRSDILVMMDSGEEKAFQGFRSQYNDARGPFKGGIRFHPDVSENEIKTLSALMTWKTALVNIPLGGGKGGVAVDPKELSLAELEGLSRGYIRSIAAHIGPALDIPAPDVGTDARIMGWMLDEYEKVVGQHVPGAITGKPLSLGGSAGREYSTAQGGFYILECIMRKIGLAKNSTVAIQGFGNVGYNMARILEYAGYKIIAVSDSHGTAINCQNGLSIEALAKYKKETGSVMGYLGAEKSSEGTACYESDADILIPSALEGTINKENAPQINARVVIEMANDPITPEAEEILDKKGVVIVPDILANAGGVVVSYFEQVQNAQNYYWSEAEVLSKLKNFMEKAFEDVWLAKEKYKTDLRTAAYILALERVAQAMSDRGQN